MQLFTLSKTEKNCREHCEGESCSEGYKCQIIKLIKNEQDDEEAFADVNEDDSCTEDLIQLYKHKMSNKN